MGALMKSTNTVGNQTIETNGKYQKRTVFEQQRRHSLKRIIASKAYKESKQTKNTTINIVN